MKKHGLVSLIGETNSGKSTLVNALVKDKVSIVSHKVQTTRNQILGVLTNKENQIIFVDTPGIFVPKKNTESFILRFAYNSLSEASIILVLLDAVKGITKVFENLLKRIEEFKDKNIILVLNKVDLISKENKVKMLEIADKLYKTKLFKEVFMISALKENGLDKLVRYLENSLDRNDWLFSEDYTSNVSLNFWATEITREKIYKYIHKELPYSIYVKPLLWNETDKAITIKQDIVVSKQSHKKIIIGGRGETIKRISIESRYELENYLDKKIHLYLFVKVDEKAFNKADIFVNESFIASKSS